MAKTLRKQARKTSCIYTIPIHGPEVTPDTVMEFLSDHLQDPPCSMYHLDIASDVSFLVCKKTYLAHLSTEFHSMERLPAYV